MFSSARARWRDVNQVRKLGRSLAWEGAKLAAILAIREGVKRVMAGPLEVDIRCAHIARVGEPLDVTVTVTSPYELKVYEIFFEDRWRKGENNGVGRRQESWRLVPHTMGLRPLIVVAHDTEGHRLRETRWIPVLPAARTRLGSDPIDVSPDSN
ncbi:MAG TPA: hypothetical protein VNZ52_01785 [Candidatus Thermoplasmatota archaeon]|nr:hypothetical protein [Candidatus Thermoplasmatota archaeon]